MKTKLLFLAITASLTSANADTFWSYIGPFSQTQMTEQQVEVENCRPDQKTLFLSVKKNGVGHIPRILIEQIKLDYSQSESEVFKARHLGRVKYATLNLEKGCPTHITLVAQSVGVNTKRHRVYVSLWGQK